VIHAIHAIHACCRCHYGCEQRYGLKVWQGSTTSEPRRFEAEGMLKGGDGDVRIGGGVHNASPPWNGRKLRSPELSSALTSTARSSSACTLASSQSSMCRKLGAGGALTRGIACGNTTEMGRVCVGSLMAQKMCEEKQTRGYGCSLEEIELVSAVKRRVEVFRYRN